MPLTVKTTSVRTRSYS